MIEKILIITDREEFVEEFLNVLLKEGYVEIVGYQWNGRSGPESEVSVVLYYEGPNESLEKAYKIFRGGDISGKDLRIA